MLGFRFVSPTDDVSAPIQERHCCSRGRGIIVSTGLGSTGWFKSLMPEAVGIASGITGQAPTLSSAPAFAWDSDYLCC